MVKIFSFCLYGPPNPRYYPTPIIQNIDLIAKHYPDWKVYLYVSPDVDSEFLNTVQKYSNVVLKPTGKLGTINRVERLFAIDETEAEIVFVRDADSRVHWKDRWAINDFLSKPYFLAHVIRDHMSHGVKIPAGLWGIRKSIGIHIQSLYKEFLKNPKDLFFGENGMDQSFLGGYLYPIIVPKLLVHYSNNKVLIGENAVKFPFVYEDSCFCGNIDGPEFIDRDVEIIKQPSNRLLLINGRFKL